MKKRRELDALVNGKSGRRKKKGQHELLRDTDSSDMGDDYLGDKTGGRKRGGALRFCPTCVAVTAFFLLTACIVTVGGLVWVHIDLKREVDHLRTQLNKVESWSQTNPDEFHDLHSNVKDINKDIQGIKATVGNHHLNISDIYRQIGVLNTTTQGLTRSLAAAPELQTLPGDVKKVSEQLVTMGSEVATMKENTKALEGLQAFKDDTSSQLTALNTRLRKLEEKPVDDGSSASSSDVNSLQRETQTLRRLIESLNFTVTNKLLTLTTQRDTNMVRVESLRNTTQTLLTRVDALDTRVTTATDVTTLHNAITTEISKLNLSSSGHVHTSLLQDLQSRATVIDNRLTAIETDLKMMATYQGLVNLTSRVDDLSINMDQHVQDLTVQEGHTTQKITDLQSRLSEHDTRLEKLERPVQPPVSGQPAQGPVNGPSGNPTSLPPLQEGLPLQSGGAPAGTPAPLNQQQTSSTDITLASPAPLPTNSPEGQDSAGDGVTESEGTRAGSEVPSRQQTGGEGRDAAVPERRAARGSRRSSGEADDDTVDSLLSALEKSVQ